MLLDVASEHEALIQFMYLAPVGLVQLGMDGEIAMINPVCAQLLMPLSRDGGLTNLFDTLENVAPDLRHQASTYAAPYELVCDALHLHLDPRGANTPQFLVLSLLKLDQQRLMAAQQGVSSSNAGGARHAGSRSSCPMPIASNASTTVVATPRATPCCAISQNCSAVASGR